MTASFVILGIVAWFVLGILGYVIADKFGSEYVADDFGLIFVMGPLSFAVSILTVIYERIRDFFV